MTDKEIKFYNKRLLKIDLALESYVDFYNDKPNKLVKLRKHLRLYRIEKDKMTDEEKFNNCKSLVDKYTKLINEIGRDKFEFYDDGDVICISK